MMSTSDSLFYTLISHYICLFNETTKTWPHCPKHWPATKDDHENVVSGLSLKRPVIPLTLPTPLHPPHPTPRARPLQPFLTRVYQTEGQAAPSFHDARRQTALDWQGLINHVRQHFPLFFQRPCLKSSPS